MYPGCPAASTYANLADLVPDLQQFRETKLSEIHAEAASRAGSRANSINRGPYPVGRGATGGTENNFGGAPKGNADGMPANANGGAINEKAANGGTTGAAGAGPDRAGST